MIGQSSELQIELPGEYVLRRIRALTLGFGFAIAAMAFASHRPDWAKGLIGGALLAWLNFLWLSRGIRAMLAVPLADAATLLQPTDEAEPAASEKPRSNAGAYFALVFRYALVAVGVYVMFMYLHIPLVSIGLGLCSLVVAVIAASVWEVISIVKQRS
jgi:putative Mn2+ efflux pump MntP